MREPQIWQAAVEPYHHYSEFFAQIIQAGIEEGSLRPMNVQIGALVLISFAVEVLLQGLFDPDGAEWDEVTREGICVLLNSWITR